MRWFLLFMTAFAGAPFLIALIKSRGSDEATIRIQILGETYRRDENPTMFTVAVSLNYVVTFAIAVLLCYQLVLIFR